MDDSGFNFLDTLSDLVERLPIWALAMAALLLLGLPFGLVTLAGATAELRHDGLWRSILLQPAIIIYTLIMAPTIRKSSDTVIAALRPVVKVDDETYMRIVAEATRVRPGHEALAFIVGLLFAVMIWQFEGNAGYMRYPMVSYAILLLSLIMFGMMGWIIYLALSRSRLTAALHHQPMQIDIFDISPFEAVGRQSLLLSLSFLGGTILSLLFVFDPRRFFTLADLIVYLVLTVSIIAIFFLNMRYTHRALATVKKEEIERAQAQINRFYRSLQTLTAEGADARDVASAINAWTTMERRLKVTRTWPYNTEMMRTLAVSILTPLAIGLSRVVIYLIQNSTE